MFIWKACKLVTHVHHDNFPIILETMKPVQLVWQTLPNCLVAPIVLVMRVTVTTFDLNLQKIFDLGKKPTLPCCYTFVIVRK